MLSEIKIRTLKANQAPGTLVYTGSNSALPPRIKALYYSAQGCQQKTGANLNEVFLAPPEGTYTWLHVEGLQDIALMEGVAKQYNLHPLTVEDILNVEQRPKIEEFDNYIFITLKTLQFAETKQTFITKSISLILGKDFVLSFQDDQAPIFKQINERICRHPDQWVAKKGSDYLAYRLFDTVVDQYFFVLEEAGDRLEKLENLIITHPVKRNARTLYHLKNQMLRIRKVIWPLREVLNHLLNSEGNLIADSTKLYLRDVHDHANQAMDVIETFREMLSNMLDVYLSNLSYRMNEIMKVLTIITTIFIPITFISSIYGMNFVHMPALQWRWGYPTVLAIMAVIAGGMLVYYRCKKWL